MTCVISHFVFKQTENCSAHDGFLECHQERKWSNDWEQLSVLTHLESNLKVFRSK